jgi:DNA-directed RNA polymerase specialized sigma subunit
VHRRISFPELPDETIKDMTRKLTAGDKSMINPLIEAHVELAYKIAGKFIGKCMDKSESKKDAIIAQALFELSRAVNNASLYDDNITKYIASSLHWNLHRFLVTDHLIPVPSDVFKRMAEEGQILEILPIQEDLDQEYDEEESFDPTGSETPAYSNKPECDLLEVMHEIKWEQNDAKIIEMLFNGHTYEEIGATFGKNKQYIMYRLKVIQRRVSETLGTMH